MDKKKIMTTVVSAVAIVWIFCISFMVSAKVAQNKRNNAVATQPSTESTTAQTTTTKPSTTRKRLPVIGNYITVEASVGDPQWLLDEQSSKREEESKRAEESSKKAEQEAADKLVPKTKQEIIDAYTVGVNKLKSEQNFTLGKVDTLEIVIDEITGGIEGLANNLINNNKPEPESYTFTGGVDSATGMTPTGVIAPLNVSAAVNPDAVVSATAEKNSDGGYTVKLALADEHQLYSGGVQTPAPNHSTMVEVIRMEDLAAGGMTITELDILYSGATVEARFNKDNKIISMYHVLPVTRCVGSGRLAIIPGDVVIHGEYTSTYSISY